MIGTIQATKASKFDQISFIQKPIKRKMTKNIYIHVKMGSCDIVYYGLIAELHILECIDAGAQVQQQYVGYRGPET